MYENVAPKLTEEEREAMRHHLYYYEEVRRFMKIVARATSRLRPYIQPIKKNKIEVYSASLINKLEKDLAQWDTSSLGLWAKQLTVPARKNVKVIPDLTEVRAYLQDAQRFLVHEGSKVKRDQVGTGEFASIRSYVIGDDPRLINWHQTAKLQEVMTNVYEPEQGKHITILIDCGRMMGVELKEGNRLERSLEAALTVAAAALQRGDYVAVLAFSKEVHTYIPPNKGIEHLQTILRSEEQTSELQSRALL